MPNKQPRRSTWKYVAAPAVLATALLLLFTMAWMTYRNVKQFAATAEWVSRSREVLNSTVGILLELNKAESAGRGYLIGKEKTFREQFHAAVANAQTGQEKLGALTLDNAEQQARISRLSSLIEPKIDTMKTFVSAWDTPDPDSAEAELMLIQGTFQMEAIRQLVTEIELAEGKLLTERTTLYRQRLQETGLTLLGSTIVSALTVLGTYFLLRSHWKLQRTSESRLALNAREKEELARYNQRLLESTGEGIYGIDRRGHCTFINQAGSLILAGKPEDFLGKDMHELVHNKLPNGDPFPKEDCPIFRSSRSGDGCRVDSEVFWRLDGSAVPVEYSSFPVKDERDEFEGAVVTFNNIAARIRIQNEMQLARDLAEAANESKSQFLANMSHELRTPLNAVIMYSELLAEEAEDRKVPDFIPDLHRIRAAGKHLLELVNGVLDLSKVEAGKMELFFEDINVPNLVNEVVSTVQPLIEKNNNSIRVEIASNATIINGDATKLRQVLYNLLSNAAKFTDEGQIRLDVQQGAGKDTLAFRIADTGIGMTPEQLERLFLPFMQADASTTRKFGGTGLGLAIIKRFTDLMGGTIDVESREKEGTTFCVSLPIRPRKPSLHQRKSRDNEGTVLTEQLPNHPGFSELASQETAQLNERSGGSGVVLVIDDDPAIRDILTRVLVAEGLQPVTAADGAEGLKRAREILPEMIILDVLMPKIDGWSVLSTLKADERLCEIPVIIQSVSEDRELAYMLGATEYLVKPVNREKLVSLLRRHVVDDNESVLVVEDDEPTRRAIVRTLEKQGWNVLQAVNGVAALAVVSAQKPAAILLDLMMPEMDGFEFLEKLNIHSEWADIPIVVLTAKDLTADDRKRLNGGVEKILAKGNLSRELFLDRVRRAVASVAIQPQNQSANS